MSLSMPIRRLVVVWLLVWVALAPAVALAQPAATPEPELWRAMLERLPPGSLIAVRLRDGARTKGTVLQVGTDRFTFKPRTRIPVPAYDVAFVEVSTIERQKPSMSPAKKVLLGVGIAALGGAGAYWLLTQPKKAAAPAKTSIGVSVAPSGIQVFGKF